MAETVNFPLRLESDLDADVRRAASDAHVSINQVLNEAIRAGLVVASRRADARSRANDPEWIKQFGRRIREDHATTLDLLSR